MKGGLIQRAVPDAMAMSPALSIAIAEIDRMIDIPREALDATAKEVGVA